MDIDSLWTKHVHLLEGTNFSEDFDEALDKLSSINVGSNQQHLTRTWIEKFMNIAEHTKDHTDQSEIIDDIITCLLHQIPPKHFTQLALMSKNLYLAALHIGHFSSRFIFICLGCRCRTSQNLCCRAIS